MRVSNLLGAKLDYWVARAEGWEVKQSESGFLLRKKDEDGLTISAYIGCYIPFVFIEYSPSTDWSQGGPIIEREHIKFKAGLFEKWHADLKAPNYKFGMDGPTFLIAAMRCFVASKFGHEVDDS